MDMVGRTYKRRFWMVLYPEGTRLNSKKLKESQDYADSKGLPRLTNVLWPRSKGFNATVECLRPGIDAVLDITVGYNEYFPETGAVRPSAGDVLLRRSKVWPLNIHVRLIPIEEVPSGQEQVVTRTLPVEGASEFSSSAGSEPRIRIVLTPVAQ